MLNHYMIVQWNLQIKDTLTAGYPYQIEDYIHV